MSIVVIELIRAALALKHGDCLGAGLRSGMALWYAWLSRGFFDDDNWFSDQFKKLRNSIKRGIKSLSERLGSLASPLPNPA